MRMKPVVSGAVIRDPFTKQPLPAEGGEVPEGPHWTRRWLAGETWREEGKEWVRRLPSGELERKPVDEPGAAAPTTETAPVRNAPVAPLTTR